jgi:hypothetical protein
MVNCQYIILRFLVARKRAWTAGLMIGSAASIPFVVKLDGMEYSRPGAAGPHQVQLEFLAGYIDLSC